ncbi:MAG: AAA family ATPase [Planctomycetota bacterium]|jgi:MoxR-like ATPase|nr:AAA family ATPase [Planctomycetota bacterium]
MSQVSNSKAQEFQDAFAAIRDEMTKSIVGYENIVDDVLTCFFAGGNCLLESAPGLGKTLIARTLSEVLELDHKRIQFTPDLMPSDIIGTTIVSETEDGKRYFDFQRGPVFTNILLADEITRATPKTQSALLEAMQERMVSVGGTSYELDHPYFVIATMSQEEESEGTYHLPEAQLDRFFFKLNLPKPDLDTLQTIGQRTTGGHKTELQHALAGEKAAELMTTVREVEVPEASERHAVNIVMGTHPESQEGSATAKKFVRYGSSPRGVQALVLGGKVRALLDGKSALEPPHIDQVASQALNHRLLLNFEGQAEGVSSQEIIGEVLQEIRAA